MQKRFFKFFSILLLTVAGVMNIACQEDQADSLAEQFQAIEASEQIEGVDLGKFDQSQAITDWLLKENQEYSMLEGRNLKGDMTFAAIIEKNPQSEETQVELLGEQNCQFTINMVSMEVSQSTCSAEEINALEIPASQLLGTFDPLLNADAQKADGLFTKIACVGAGIGASVLSLIVWQFASSVAIAGASISTTVPILTAGSSVIGAVALCYSAFAGESDLSSCVGDCEDDLMCVETCVDQAKNLQANAAGEEESAVAAAGQMLQCIGSCDAGEACESICYEMLESVNPSSDMEMISEE